MARTFGFRPVGGKTASLWSGQVTAYTINSDTANSFYKGDLAKTAAAIAGNPAKTGPAVEKYTSVDAGNSVKPLGVFESFLYKPPLNSQNSSPQPFFATGTQILPGTEILAYVNDDPNLVMEVVCTKTDGTDQGLVKAQLWYRAKPSVLVAKNGLNESGMSLDVQTAQAAAGATLSFRIIGLSNRPNGNNFGATASNVAVVCFDLHEFK
jgi:hypothetical protein